jgi:hypothetical protein
MGGVLHITAEPLATWLPQSRVFDSAVRAIADAPTGDAELAERLRTASDHGYLDVRGLDPARFRALADAAGRAVAAELERGPAPDNAQRRLRYGLSLLHALVAADPRAETPPGDDELAIRDHIAWRAPAATARLAREHLAAAAGGDAAALDLRAVSPSDFGPMLDACDWMVARYAPGANLEADADAALAILHPPITGLQARLREDPRAGRG